jgi:hypothetical protein
MVSAFFVGALVGLTGVGAGAVMTPLLILVFSVSPAVAIATALVFATVTKLFSAAVHLRRDSVDWAAARSIWKGSIPGVFSGIAVVVYVGVQFDFLLTLFLALVIISTSLSMLRPVRFEGRAKGLSSLFGRGFIGFSVATTSVGAGALGMVLLRRQIGDESPKKLVGTAIVHSIPIALIAGLTYGAGGLVDLELLLVILLGSIPGALLGSRFTDRVRPEFLRKVLAIVLLVAAGALLRNLMGAIA